MPDKILLVETIRLAVPTSQGFCDYIPTKWWKCPDGEEALKLLAAEAIDLVVSDLALPTLHGLNLTEQINSKWPSSAKPMIRLDHDD